MVWRGAMPYLCADVARAHDCQMVNRLQDKHDSIEDARVALQARDTPTHGPTTPWTTPPMDHHTHGPAPHLQATSLGPSPLERAPHAGMVTWQVATQLYSNALVAAGLMDDPRTMIPSLNELMSQVLKPYDDTPSADKASE